MLGKARSSHPSDCMKSLIISGLLLAGLTASADPQTNKDANTSADAKEAAPTPDQKAASKAKADADKARAEHAADAAKAKADHAADAKKAR